MISGLLTSLAMIAGVAVSAALYLLPLLVGWGRRVPDLGAVAVVNILLGWTLVGWVVALAMALRSAATAGTVVQVVQNPPPPPQAMQEAGWTGPPGVPAPRAGPPPPLVLPPRPGGQD